MKRVGCMICAIALMLLCCACGDPVALDEPIVGEVTDDVQPYFPEEPVPVVVPLVERLENGDIKATIHAGLLAEDESEVLTEEQKADGFIDAVRNDDMSVTYTIAADRYEDCVKKVQQECRDEIVNGTATGAFESVYAAEVNEDFTFVKATAESVGYSGLDAAEACFQLSIYAIRAQAFDINAAGTCVISVVDETTGAEHERHTYPDEMHLFPAEE